VRPRLRRVAVVGTAVTIVDLATLAAARATGLPVATADAAAVAVAAAVSWPLHRRLSLDDDPHIRWVRQPRAYVTTAVASGAVDVALTRLLAGPLPLPLAKGVGLGAAAVGRLVAYRALLLTDVRRELGIRQAREAAPGDRRFTVVVPAYRAAAVIGSTIARIDRALAEVDHEVLVVVDGSPDDTAEVARAAGARVVELPVNRGKGAAVRAGVLAAAGRTVAFTDADLAYAPEQLVELLDEVESGWDVAVGNRWKSGSRRAGQGVLRRLSSRMFNLLTATVLLGQYRDTQCGLKAFRSDVARQLFSRTRLDGFAFDVEVLHLVERDRCSLVEVPVRVEEDGSSTVRLGSAVPRMMADLFRVRRWAGQGRYDR
jgi:dolichyl-phosphate beta-glucosyltransferase